jgi:hypothetical protein
MEAEDASFTRPLIPFDCEAMGGCGSGTKRVPNPKKSCAVDYKEDIKKYDWNWYENWEAEERKKDEERRQQQLQQQSQLKQRFRKPVENINSNPIVGEELLGGIDKTRRKKRRGRGKGRKGGGDVGGNDNDGTTGGSYDGD